MKKKSNTFKKILLMFAAVQCLASECENRDCEWACSHLADCENLWLRKEGKSEMSDAAYGNYLDSCRDDCRGADQNYIDCVIDASCTQLSDGECR